MSSSCCFDCISDLICDEDAGILAADEDFQDFVFPADTEESIAGFVEEEERDFLPFRFESVDVAAARRESVSWILKVQAFYGFQPLTAYLSINYMDRFLASRGMPWSVKLKVEHVVEHRTETSIHWQANGWPLQLLSIACLSLAAKMEEPLVPTLFDLQVEGAKFIFEARTIYKMELLVLTTLNWRLRSITPFTFIDFFASKVDSTCSGYLILRATQIILTTISDINFLDYSPSAVSIASILHAANEIPNLFPVTAESAVTWCQGLRKERIMGCYQLMKEVVVGQKQRKPPKVLPQHRVMTHTQMDSGESSTSSSSASSSSSSSSFSSKRRKLNNYNDNDHLEETKQGEKRSATASDS